MSFQFVTSNEIAKPGGPFSPAVVASFGSLLFFSGQVAYDHNGAVVGVGNPGEQTRQCLRNLDALLRSAGAPRTSIVRLTIFLTNMADRAAIAEARREYFGNHHPAATLVEVKGLVHPELVVEIEATGAL